MEHGDVFLQTVVGHRHVGAQFRHRRILTSNLRNQSVDGFRQRMAEQTKPFTRIIFRCAPAFSGIAAQ